MLEALGSPGNLGCGPPRTMASECSTRYLRRDAAADVQHHISSQSGPSEEGGDDRKADVTKPRSARACDEDDNGFLVAVDSAWKATRFHLVCVSPIAHDALLLFLCELKRARCKLGSVSTRPPRA